MMIALLTSNVSGQPLHRLCHPNKYARRLPSSHALPEPRFQLLLLGASHHVFSAFTVRSTAARWKTDIYPGSPWVQSDRAVHDGTIYALYFSRIRADTCIIGLGIPTYLERGRERCILAGPSNPAWRFPCEFHFPKHRSRPCGYARTLCHFISAMRTCMSNTWLVEILTTV